MRYCHRSQKFVVTINRVELNGMVTKELENKKDSTNSLPIIKLWIGRLLRYGPPSIWIYVIFFASSDQMSSPHTSGFIRPLLKWLFAGAEEETIEFMHKGIRKLAHFTEYAFFAIFLARAFTTSTKLWLKLYWFQLSLLGVIIFALLDEYHQTFIPSRSGSIYDSLIDIFGGLTMLLIIKWFLKRKHKKLATLNATKFSQEKS